MGDVLEEEVASEDVNDGATKFIMMPNIEKAIKIYHFFMLLFCHFITVIRKSKMLAIMYSLNALFMVPAFWKETHDLVVRDMVESFFINLLSNSIKLFLLIFCESRLSPFHPVTRVFSVLAFFEIVQACWIL